MGKDKQSGGVSTAESSTGLAVVDSNSYSVLVPGSKASSILRMNLGGEDMSVSDLDRVKVPSGGATFWTVVDAAGERPQAAIEGILVHTARRRAYWKDQNPSGSPPDCGSSDCITGYGNPGGECAKCPLNVFGSAVRQDGTQGRGKRCKEVGLLFLLQQGGALPTVISVPPASLKQLRTYKVRLAGMELPFYSVITRLTLSRVKSGDGIDFAQIVPSMAAKLDEAAVKQVQEYISVLGPLFNSTQVERGNDGED